MSVEPFLSVIVPAYNRDRFILRAIASVRADDAGDFEIIVVDDGSTDRTADVVATLADSRLQLIRHEVNLGRCAARNTGAAAARGEWIVFLDSDDELVPGGLAMIRARARVAPPHVGKLRFMCRDDDGGILPRPPFDGRVVDYAGYLGWLEQASNGSTEALACVRRADFLQCQYPTGRFWWEGIHELDFARQRCLQHCPEVVRLYHRDAVNRIGEPTVAALLAQAPDGAAHAAAIAERHGEALRLLAPSAWLVNAREAALFRFLNGERGSGVSQTLAVFRRQPFMFRAWVVLLVGLVGAYPLAKLKVLARAGAPT